MKVMLKGIESSLSGIQVVLLLSVCVLQMELILLSSWPTHHYWYMPSPSLLLFMFPFYFTMVPFPFSPQATAVLHLMSICFAHIYFYKMFTILLHVFLMHVSDITSYNLILFLSLFSLYTMFLRFLHVAVLKSNLWLLIAA